MLLNELFELYELFEKRRSMSSRSCRSTSCTAIASIHQQFQLFGEGFEIETGDGSILHVNGDVWRWNFSVTDEAGRLLAQIGRQFSIIDSYAIDVEQGVDAPFMVALVIVIDMVRQHHEQAEH